MIYANRAKDINKMVQISELVQKHGYKKENIHLVWIVTDFKIALEQNSERDRKVPEDILKFTHIGANNTMYDIIHEYNKYKAYLDGDIWIIPNKRGIDNTFYQSKTSSGKTLFVLEKYKKIKLKTAGKELSISDINKQLSSEIKEKLNEYTPKDAKSGNF